jgi:hypothetical protein
MKYHDGSNVSLGDVVNVPVPGGTAKARVVMLGDTYEHLDIKEGFVAWVKRDKVLKPTSIVIEWLSANPFEHDDPQYAPVGNYMFSPLDEWVTRDA